MVILHFTCDELLHSGKLLKIYSICFSKMCLNSIISTYTQQKSNQKIIKCTKSKKWSPWSPSRQFTHTFSSFVGKDGKQLCFKAKCLSHHFWLKMNSEKYDGSLLAISQTTWTVKKENATLFIWSTIIPFSNWYHDDAMLCYHYDYQVEPRKPIILNKNRELLNPTILSSRICGKNRGPMCVFQGNKCFL